MTDEEMLNLKSWLINMNVRLDNEVTEARNDFQRDENSWFAFRLALASERRNAFDLFSAQLWALLKVR